MNALRRLVTEAERNQNPAQVHDRLTLTDDLRVRLGFGDASPRLVFTPNHYSQDEEGRWWHNSGTYSLSVSSGTQCLFVFHVVNGRVRDCAFASHLAAAEIPQAAELLTQEGLGGWVLPGLRGVFRFHTGLHKDLDPEKVIRFAQLLEQEQDTPGAVELPRRSHELRTRAHPTDRRKWIAAQRRFENLTIDAERRFSLRDKATGEGLSYKLIYYQGSWEGLWWYDATHAAIYVEHGSAEVFSFYLEKDRVIGAAFLPDSDLSRIRTTARHLEKAGFGAWRLPALQRTLWFLGSRRRPETKKIISLAKMMIALKLNNAESLELPRAPTEF